MYKHLYPDVQEESVLGNFERFSSIEIGGERYGSSESRSIRSSYILASWVITGGRIEISPSEPRAGCVKFYVRQNVYIGGEYRCFLLAYVVRKSPGAVLFWSAVEGVLQRSV